MDESELEKLGIGKLGVPWHTRIMLKFWPRFYMWRAAKKIGVTDPLFDKAHEIFSKVERIDLFPSGGAEGRSLIMVLDSKTALFFYQDGNHFKYDGFEMGEYNKGEVTVFDKIKNPPTPYP